MNNGVIGIVGGMGPSAGIDLSSKIVSQTLASSDQQHISQLLFSFPSQISDRTEFITGREKINPGRAIADILIKLETCGVSVAGLACNSAHAPVIFDQITSILNREGAKIKLLHMVRETALFIRQYYPHAGKAGVLGTTGTFISGLYNLLEEYGLAVQNVTEAEQVQIHSAIYDPVFGIKSVPDGVSPKAFKLLYSACRSLKAKGADLFVLGCTELPLAVRGTELDGLPVIDPGLVLARALIREAAPEKLKPWMCNGKAAH